MKKLIHLREKAVNLRKNGYTLNDIVERLNRSKTTIYYWIKDVPIEKQNVFIKRRKDHCKKSWKNAALATKKKYKALHKEARGQAKEKWENELKYSTDFKLFIMLYWCEGYKKTKHTPSVCNSDANLIKFGFEWIKKLTTKSCSKIKYVFKYMKIIIKKK